MAEVKKINVGPVLTAPLALARRGGQIATDNFQKHGVSAKLSAIKDHPHVAKITEHSDKVWTVVGIVLILHGAQFKSLFLCSQVMMAFCFSRLKGSILALHSDLMTAWDKISEDSKADAKAEAKPADKQKEDAAATKKLLKILDSDKVSGAVFEVCVSAMMCHMVMQGGLPKVIIVAYTLVKCSREKINTLLVFTGHEDMQAWTDSILSFLLYVVFGLMAFIARPLAFALAVSLSGAQLVVHHGLRQAENMGKLPGAADAFEASTKGLALLGGLTAFGTLWQFWALMADSGMAWYFKMLYLPAYFAEGLISLL